MANFDIERKKELNDKLKEQNRYFCELQHDFKNTFNGNSILLESKLINLSIEISNTLREIRVKGRSESVCKSKEFENDILYFLKKENIIGGYLL